jgi:fructose-specific phosphotransferase system IIC component
MSEQQAAASWGPGSRRVRAVRLRRFSIRGALLAGMVAGFTAGLFAGCVAGAILSWLAGQALDWQAHLAFQLGVTEDLLPLGPQTGLLQAMQDDWWLVVPATGLVLAVPGAITWGLGAALLTAVFNGVNPPVELLVEDVPRQLD